MSKSIVNGMVMTALAVCGALCAAGATSDSVGLTLCPEKSPFWRTATNSTMTLRIDYPSTASSCELTVHGMNFSTTIPGITEDVCTLVLPTPSSLEAEDVYELTLTFEDETRRTASLAVVAGSGTDEANSVRILSDATRKWSRTGASTVLPVPYGTTALTIDGETVDTGLDGACGWYGWKGIPSGAHALRLEGEYGSVEVEVSRRNDGVVILLR